MTVVHQHDTGLQQTFALIDPAVHVRSRNGARFNATHLTVVYRRDRVDGCHGHWTWHVTVSGHRGSRACSTAWTPDDDPRDVPEFVTRYVLDRHPERPTR